MSVRATPSGQPAGGATPPSPAVSAKGAHQAQFTPGPWSYHDSAMKPVDGDEGKRFWQVCAGHVHKSPSSDRLCGYIACPDMSVAHVQFGPAEANARLIAAAPDLLKACERIRDEKAPSYHDCIDNGEPECAWCAVFNAIAKARGEAA